MVFEFVSNFGFGISDLSLRIMNSKEKTVIIFLCITFIAGASISLWRAKQNQSECEQIELKQTNIEKMSDENNFAANDKKERNTKSTNINTATQKELEQLSGIGPVLAQRIIEYREKNQGFKTKQELMKINGIGIRKFDAIKSQITIQPDR